jgi:hypothetical protein
VASISIVEMTVRANMYEVMPAAVASLTSGPSKPE